VTTAPPDGYVPAGGAVVTTQPEVFRVTTSDALLDGATAGIQSRMLITGPAGAAEPRYYGDGCVSIVGAAIETTAALGEPGEYTVDWQAVSVDGHPISATFSFTWQPAEGQSLAEGATAKPDCGGTVSYGSGSPQTDGEAAAVPADASLSDVLWIGGALGAVALAATATILVVTRRRGPGAPSGPTP